MLLKSAAGQLETKKRDFCVIRESKPPGDYIMNFYRPKYVTCKKTESREHTRCPRGRGRAQGGGPATHTPRRLVLPRLLLIFLNIPKRRNITIKTVLESVYLPYHIHIPFQSLKHFGKCPLCIPPGLRFQYHWFQHLWDYLRYNV